MIQQSRFESVLSAGFPNLNNSSESERFGLCSNKYSTASGVKAMGAFRINHFVNCVK